MGTGSGFMRRQRSGDQPVTENGRFDSAWLSEASEDVCLRRGRTEAAESCNGVKLLRRRRWLPW
jgi:hypothetical protein